VSSDGLQPGVSATRGWGWVFGGGTTVAVVATWTGLDDGLWAMFTSLVAWVWGLPYVPAVVVGAGVVAALAFGIWLRARRRHD
jgi:hypothetical protein